ncbi:MAG: hypothetical protein IPH93_01465 [Saprospiraceae bacterium]|nr:hypothetical protein [Saprospiraceae bacterium]
MVSEQNKSDQLEDFDLEKNRFPLAEAYIAGSSNDINKAASLMQGVNKAFVLSKTWNTKLNAEPIFVEPKVINQETTEILPIEAIDEIQENEQSLEIELEPTPTEIETFETSQTIEPVQLKESFIQKPKIKKSKEKVSESKSKSLPTEKKKLKGRIIRSIEPLEDKLAQDNLEPKLKKSKKEISAKSKSVKNSGIVKVDQLITNAKLKPNDFYSWLDSLNQTSPLKRDKKASKSLNKVKSDISDSLSQKAKKSQELKAEVASETLAALLASQGHKAKAIKMYEKLIRKNPEKPLSLPPLLKN